MRGESRGRSRVRSHEEGSDGDDDTYHDTPQYRSSRPSSSPRPSSPPRRRQPSRISKLSQKSRQFHMLKLLFPFFASFNIKGLNLAYGALMYGYKEIQITSHTSYLAMSWIGSLYTAALLISFPLAKLITDLLARSSRKTNGLETNDLETNGSKTNVWISVVVTLGVCFRSALLLGIPSLTSSTTLIILHGILLGVTDGMIYSLSIITLDATFYQNPLKYAATIRIGAGLGGVVYAAILRTCLSTVHFEWGVRIIALCGAGTMIPSLFFLPDVQGGQPAEQSESMSKVLIFEDIVGKSSTKRDPSSTCTVLGMFFTFASVYYGYHFIVLYGIHAAHRSPADSMLFVIEMCACHVLGIVMSNILKRYLGDQLGVLTFAILSMSQTIFTWIGANQNAGLIMFVCFYGFYSAAVDSMHLTCQLTYMNRYRSLNSADDSTRTAGMRHKVLFFFLAMSIGGLLGGVSAACLIDYHNGVFWFANLLSAAWPFAGSIFFLTAIALRKRRTNTGT